MKLRLAGWALLLVAALSFQATPRAYWQSRSQVSASVAAAYVGPGDIVSTASAWWGLRGYNAAFSGPVATICDVATGLVCANATWSGSTLTLPTIGGSACSVVACNVSKLFDQTGNGFDLLQTTNANRPGLTTSCVGSLPCLAFVRASGQVMTSATGPTSGYPFTYSTVAKRTGNTSSAQFIVQSAGSGGGLAIMYFFNGTNTVALFAGGLAPTATASDSSFHAIQGVLGATGNNSALYIDGSDNVLDIQGGETLAGALALGGQSAGANNVDGNIAEAGIWPIGFSAGNKSGMNTNQHSYWGF